jgi:uncharacterized membrane protein
MYKAIFSIITVTGIVLIVMGYPQVEYNLVFSPPEWGRAVTASLMLISLVFFAAANMPGNLKRFTRHPMLWGLVIWAIAHLFSNGDRAAVVLFVSLGLFALVAMLSANLRGAKKQKQKVPYTKDIMAIFAGIIAYMILVFVHPYLFGVAVL